LPRAALKVGLPGKWLKRQLKQVPLIVEARLLLRGLAHVGFRHRCNCCGWRLRAFVERDQFFGASHDGYCPRCDAKARHRGLWLFLKNNGLLSSSRLRLLHVGPWPKIASLVSALENVEYVGVDILPLPHVTMIADITSLPVEDASFDALICVHVLEHVVDDRTAISEFNRILKPGGWALISVPMRTDRPTFEDPAVTEPKDRKRVFGEAGHVRYYGTDFVRRLEAAGFHARLHRDIDVEASIRQLHGLRETENMFFCTRLATPA
jgi:SAM-dependent methyltransferase